MCIRDRQKATDDAAAKKKAQKRKMSAWMKSPERAEFDAAQKKEMEPIEKAHDEKWQTYRTLDKKPSKERSEEDDAEIKKAKDEWWSSERDRIKKKNAIEDKYDAERKAAFEKFKGPDDDSEKKDDSKKNEGYIKLRDLIRM